MTARDRVPSWGPVFLPDGSVRFRLWAPACGSVALRLEGGDVAMARGAGGWFEAVTRAARAGDAYAFVLDGGAARPDPAARAQVGDVYGPSRLVDPGGYAWRAAEWAGRPWEEAVVYEAHVGTFTPAGTFRGAIDRLDHLIDLGVTALELMPVAQFAGDRGWGYDGVLVYAPHPAYGAPDDLKALVDAAHERGLMILLDVVYNHFGPEGAYLRDYAPQFFDPDRHTPWGAGIAYHERPVRDFFVDNALYWLEEFRFDGLRLDAIDQIVDPSSPSILEEIARTVRARTEGRHVHLTTEDSRNIVGLHRRGASGAASLYTGEWNDDFHNAAHVIATGEADGYYSDFADDPWRHFARALAEGFSYQGEHSGHFGAPRGESTADLPPVAFISFLQNHDQTGNRAFGERLISLTDPERLEVLTAALILAPHIPLLFMGEEWGETCPFLFFADFHGDLADAVRDGRRQEFAAFAAFADARRRATIPDPNALDTFAASKIDWPRAQTADGGRWLGLYRELLSIRRSRIAPHLAATGGGAGTVLAVEEGFCAVAWRLHGAHLSLAINLSDAPRAGRLPREHEVLYRTGAGEEDEVPTPGIVVRLGEAAR